MVITRRNDRRLGISGSDWVKNGDRWIATGIKDGALSVRHRESALHATLPVSYVAAHVELGYASTVHTAQGLTADVMHGVVTGEESRQKLYTMLTRGRVENHVHAVLAYVAEDHALPSPTLERRATATELLEDIVARDGATVSATTARAVAASPEAQLQDAVTRYADALTLAASKVRAGPGRCAERSAPLDGRRSGRTRRSPRVGSYLTARARRVGILTDKVRTQATSTFPEWTRRNDDILTPELRGDLAIWRAATGVSRTTARSPVRCPTTTARRRTTAI